MKQITKEGRRTKIVYVFSCLYCKTEWEDDSNEVDENHHRLSICPMSWCGHKGTYKFPRFYYLEGQRWRLENF